ncbi:TPA: hypothetical protein J1Z36_002111 [Escherichia coli]|nr:hypothetical protein [Escherichia coli]NJQ41448.1 hypothetical protein [Escherichia coli]HBA7703678.1 hypothetical protein [Escherichia coli]HBA7752063.1 hypothetical protein [Escherichia coli]
MVNLTTRCPQRGRNNPAILTAAPFRGVPQPEAHGRRKFNDRLSMNQLQEASGGELQYDPKVYDEYRKTKRAGRLNNENHS